MKIKMYTKSHNEELLKEINPDNQFTAEEHTAVLEKEFGERYKTKEGLLQAGLFANSEKLCALGFLIKYVIKHEYKSVLSLGAGQCCLEYLLRLALPDEVKVTAVDFDSFFIRLARQHFPEIVSAQYDFFKDDVLELQNKMMTKFDLAVFFSSAYVMDDQIFIKQFAGLNRGGVKTIIDFHAGYIPFSVACKKYLFMARSYFVNLLRRTVFGKYIKKASFKGKFHGYGRTRNELRKLYKASGFTIKRELSLANYKYVAILEANSA